MKHLHEMSWEECEHTFRAEIKSMHKYLEKCKIDLDDFNSLDPTVKIGCLLLWKKQELIELDKKLKELIKE